MRRFFALFSILLTVLLTAPVLVELRSDPPVDHPRPFHGLYDSIRTQLSAYLWPTESTKRITSSFAEFRSTHFHGGIDIGTGSRTGYRVFAMRDGYVARISVEPTGYGRMLYVRHVDGFTTTFAHLKHFSPAIDERVAGEQRRLEQYPVDIRCAPGEFPVRQGDLIAFTGESGVGSPHLHFELRDENMNFVNPLLCDNINFQDNIPPEVRKIAISPLAEHSQVNGSWTPLVFPVRKGKNHRYVIDEPLHVTGSAGFAVSARDKTNGSPFRHGVYSHQVFIDDELVYYVQLDRVPAREAHQIWLYYDSELLDEGEGRFEKLYMDSPNTLPFYQPRSDTAGILVSAAFAEGPHTFRILSGDYNNNTTTVEGTIIFNHPPFLDVHREEDALTVRFDDIKRIAWTRVYWKSTTSSHWKSRTVMPDLDAPDNLQHLPLPRPVPEIVKVVAENMWGTRSLPRLIYNLRSPGASGSMALRYTHDGKRVHVHLTTNRSFSTDPELAVYEGETRRLVELEPVDDNEYRGVFSPDPTCAGTRRLVATGEVNGHQASANAEFDLYPIQAGAFGVIPVDGGNLTIAYDPASVFTTVFLSITRDVVDGDVVYSLAPRRTVLNRGFSVTMRSEPGSNHRGLYFGAGGDMNLIARPAGDSSATITGRITRWLGDVAVLSDDEPPTIGRLAVHGNALPRISFHFGDNLSGVEYESLKVYIDGIFIIPEVDGEHRRVVCQPVEPLGRGTHQLLIRVNDRAGNLREVDRRFAVR